MKVCILVGLQLSGKSSHGYKLNQEKDVPMIETGHAVYHELKKQGMEVNHENTTKIIKELLSQDPTAFTRTILSAEKNKYKNSDILILNGVKSPAEISYVRENFGKERVLVLSFHATQKTRFFRVKNPDRFKVSGKFHAKTQEDEDLANWKNFIERDKREIKLGIGEAIAQSHEIIVTEDKIWPYHSFNQSYKIFKEIILEIL